MEPRGQGSKKGTERERRWKQIKMEDSFSIDKMMDRHACTMTKQKEIEKKKEANTCKMLI